MNKSLFKMITLIPLLASVFSATGCVNLDGLEGKELFDKLHESITPANQAKLNYDSLFTYYKKTDRDPENKDHIFLFYTGTSFDFSSSIGSVGNGKSPGLLNREHVWPQSKFRAYGNDDYPDTVVYPGPYSDIYNVRPCREIVNQNRSNYPFGEHEGTSEEAHMFDPKYDADSKWDTSDESYRGDLARILFYVAVRYPLVELVDYNTVGGNQMGKLSDLLKWNLQYPPTDKERLRNEEGYKIQGNKNPFVDHPEYACRIYKNDSEDTKRVCGGN